MISDAQVTEIAKKYYQQIFNFCNMNVNFNSEVAEDITQEVFLTFQLKHDVLEDEHIHAWLISTAHNKCMEYFREAKKSHDFVPLDESCASIEYEELFDLLDSCVPAGDSCMEKYINLLLMSLTESERVLFQKLYVEKKKHKQIATELGITLDAADARAKRLNKKVRRIVHFLTTAIGQAIIKMIF